MARQKSGSGAAKSGSAKMARRQAMGSRKRKAAGPLSLTAPARDAKLRNLKIGDLYRPLKKPITVRLDADVLAWFKKDGKRYQTRINQALRKVMEREMKTRG
jgi:uncharacterized protein (DUF4415 family)